MIIELEVEKIPDSTNKTKRIGFIVPEKSIVKIGNWPDNSGVSIVIEGFEYLFSEADLQRILEFLKGEDIHE